MKTSKLFLQALFVIGAFRCSPVKQFAENEIEIELSSISEQEILDHKMGIYWDVFWAAQNSGQNMDQAHASAVAASDFPFSKSSVFQVDQQKLLEFR